MRVALAHAVLLFMILHSTGCVAPVRPRERERAPAAAKPPVAVLNEVMDTFTGSPGAGVSVGPGIGVISEALVGDQIQSRERKEHEIQLQILQQQLEIRRQQLEIRRQQIEIESLRKSLQGFY